MKKVIKNYFNKMSEGRDISIKKSPIIDYEQKMRQKRLFELLKPHRQDYILDVGCGNARDMVFLAKNNIKSVGIDFSEGMLQEGRIKVKKNNFKNCKLYQGDATKLPFKEETFDKVYASEILEHIPEYELAMGECVRVLKKNGKFVVTTPNILSLYGLNKFIFNVIRKILKLKEKHPYDDWKTQKELIKTSKRFNLKVKEKVGICYLPGEFSYKLPIIFQKYLVKIISPIENIVYKKLNKFGYMVGISFIKK